MTHFDARPDRQLHVVAVFFNHNRRVNPVLNFKRFRRHAEHELGLSLCAVELVLGDLPFEVTRSDNPLDVQLRTDGEFFQKENLANIGLRHVVRMAPEAKYLALVDADIRFFNPAVVDDTIVMLNRFPVGQMWAMACDLGPDGHPLVHPGPDYGAQVSRSFGYCHQHGLEPTSVTKRYGYEWHPGYAWAFRRSAWEAMGGLYEHSIVGSADLHMAWAFIGKLGWGMDPDATPAFQEDLRRWCGGAAAAAGDVGYVDGLVHHHWHGRKTDRRYMARWSALVDNGYDPALDLTRDVHGLLHLTNRSPALRRDLRNYLRARNDDANTVS